MLTSVPALAKYNQIRILLRTRNCADHKRRINTESKANCFWGKMAAHCSFPCSGRVDNGGPGQLYVLIKYVILYQFFKLSGISVVAS